MKMKKIVEVTIDINIARRMLAVAGFHNEVKDMNEDEIFEKTLTMIEEYGAKSTIISNVIDDLSNG